MVRLVPGLTAGLLCVVFRGALAPGDEAEKPKEVRPAYAFDLATRQRGEEKITRRTRRFAVEALKDLNTNLGLYATSTASVALAAGFADVRPPLKGSKAPGWYTGFELRARQAGEFPKPDKFHPVEVYRDTNTGNWLYLTSEGHLAATAVKGRAPDKPKKPVWAHAAVLTARKAGEDGWEGAARFGLEVYRHTDTGNLIYVSETGALAVIAEGKKVLWKQGDRTGWLYRLELAVRRYDEKSFSAKTRRYGIEVFHDPTTGNLIYVCETGRFAVTAAPAIKKAPLAGPKAAKWAHRLSFKARAPGEKAVTGKARTDGAEAYRDPNAGVTLCIVENGALSALATK
jgi:hypothetical protein